MSSNDAPFRALPHDEFVKLSLDEKMAYLARAGAAFKGKRAVATARSRPEAKPAAPRPRVRAPSPT